jgi:hypothetical protein
MASLWDQLPAAIVLGLATGLAVAWPLQELIVQPTHDDMNGEALGELTTQWCGAVVVLATIAFVRIFRRLHAGEPL